MKKYSAYLEKWRTGRVGKKTALELQQEEKVRIKMEFPLDSQKEVHVLQVGYSTQKDHMQPRHWKLCKNPLKWEGKQMFLLLLSFSSFLISCLFWVRLIDFKMPDSGNIGGGCNICREIPDVQLSLILSNEKDSRKLIYFQP